MLRIAICDDEEFYREKLQALVQNYLLNHDLAGNFSLFSSGEEFLGQCENQVKYDIVFMDITMDALSGIQTALRMRSFISAAAASQPIWKNPRVALLVLER